LFEPTDNSGGARLKIKSADEAENCFKKKRKILDER
jgi:hypothetical protein